MSAIVCSKALRAVGEDLEARGIKAFLIRCDADLYVVEAGYQSPPAPTPVTLHYTLEDIERLDQERRQRSDYSSGGKDFLRLSQTLQAIGSYVSWKRARLLSVSNNVSTGTMPLIRIEYETAQGERVIDDRTCSAVYDLCVSIYKRRELSVNHFRDIHWHGAPLLLRRE
jgi:hypothetical protein